jgi:endonuclease YncB( thermonuclease family)
MPALGLGLVWLAASVWLAFMATERFPEFVGPVVRMGSQQTITGPVTHIRDGDTIEVAGVSVRFGSLDCAEIRTTEGRTATATITRLIAEQELTCYLNGRTSYDRKIGSCVLPDGRDLAAEMIRGGYCSRYW